MKFRWNVSSYKPSGFPQHTYFNHFNEMENIGKFRLRQMRSSMHKAKSTLKLNLSFSYSEFFSWWPTKTALLGNLTMKAILVWQCWILCLKFFKNTLRFKKKKSSRSRNKPWNVIAGLKNIFYPKTIESLKRKPTGILPSAWTINYHVNSGILTPQTCHIKNYSIRTILT